VDVRGEIELGEDLPELVVGGLVVVEVGLAVGTGVLEVPTESTVASEHLNTATQLLASLLGFCMDRYAKAPMQSRLFLIWSATQLLVSVAVFSARDLSDPDAGCR
jgi:hypothetical protein